jgi:L,D-peptidoglycan transpeptidase YkuD (ErfK/YbiS/YcfS/YnhG family)
MRPRILPAGLAAALGVAGALVVASSPASATCTRPSVLQWVTVSAPTSTSTYATVEAWTWQGNTICKFKRVALFTRARIGAAGMGPTREGLSRTPTGRYLLTQPFGTAYPPSGMTFPYSTVDRNDIWSDSTYPAYGNRHARCAPGTCSYLYGNFERLSSFPTPYRYAAFIGYNAPAPYGTGVVAGKGSAFFLHVKTSGPTAGCVAVSEAQMVWLLRWMRPGSRPAVAIGVGANAYNPIPNRYI